MTNADNVVAMRELVGRHDFLAPALIEHMDDNFGEILPHLFMGDVMRWLVAHWDDRRVECHDLLDWLDEAYQRGPESLREVVVQSGVENVPDPGEPGAEIRDALSKRLREWDPCR